MEGNAMTGSFLHNVWYQCAWAEEIGDKPLARSIADVPLVFFRRADNSITALHDMCPHRFAPLSMGKLKDGALHCGYHGLAFGADGKCVLNPHGPIVPALKVASYPLIERHSALWVWLGDVALADPATIPDFAFIDAVPPEARVTGYLANDADYMLMTENIMDLSHADYLHPDTLGGGINTRARGKVEETNGCVIVRWHVDNDFLPPVMNGFLPVPGERGDYRNDVYWYPPGNMKQRLAFAPHGLIDTKCEDSWTSHVMTPAAVGSTHYFFCHTSTTLSRDPKLAPVVRDILMRAFSTEDSPMLAAQQKRIGGREFWSLKPVMLPVDKAAVRVRRTVEAMLAAEQSRGEIRSAAE